MPEVSQVAVISVATNPWHPYAVSALTTGARALGVKLTVLTVRDPRDFEPIFADVTREGVPAVLVLEDPMTFFHRNSLAQLGLRHRLATAYGLREHAEVGGLMSYWAEAETLYRRTAAYVDKLLRGAKAADLPVEQPSKYEFVINLRTARALGIEVPPTLLAQADEVIE